MAQLEKKNLGCRCPTRKPTGFNDFFALLRELPREMIQFDECQLGSNHQVALFVRKANFLIVKETSQEYINILEFVFFCKVMCFCSAMDLFHTFFSISITSMSIAQSILNT